MTVKTFILALGLAAATATAARADHEARFNFDKTLTVTGVLGALAWQNPRVFLYLDIAGADGKSERRPVMTGAPVQLTKAGLAKTDLAIGATFVAEVNPERAPNGKMLFLTVLTLPDGRTVKLGM